MIFRHVRILAMHCWSCRGEVIMAAYGMKMRSTCTSTVMLFLLLFSLVLSSLFLPLAFGQDQFVGNVKLVESKDPAQHPHIVRMGYSAILDIKPGDAVFLGDTVKTGEDIKAQIQLSDGSIVIVAPNSVIQMKGHLVDRERGTRNSVMQALKGTIRFMISKVFKPHATGPEMNWKESNVTIETHNAIAGVRGTDFVVTSGMDDSEIAVFDGAVSVKSSSSSVNGGIMLGADQFTTVKKGKSPEPASALSPARKESLIGLTTLVNPRSAENNAKDGASKKKAKYTDKDIARDLAAGLSLGAVMDKAVELGMPIEQVTTSMIDAGVHPSNVVYTAITEGYSAKQVCCAAIEHGAPLSVVAAAALGAGADRKTVIAGAREAGVPPAAIAAAIANVSSPGGPVYGSALSQGSTPVVAIPAPPPVIGGGGGGTPSTQPASPYRPSKPYRF